MACGTLAGLALAGGGTAMQMIGGAQSRDAMNRDINNQIARQQEFTKKQQALSQQNAANATPQAFQNQLDQGKSQYLNAAHNAQAAPLALAAPAVGGAQGADQQARQSMSNEANAGFMGYGNPALQQSMGNTLTNANMNVNNSLAQGWANVLPIQLRSDESVGQGLRSGGGLLSTLGSLAMMSGFGSPASSVGMTPSTTSMGALGSGFGPVSNTWAGANAGLLSAPTMGLGSPSLGLLGATKFPLTGSFDPYAFLYQ